MLFHRNYRVKVQKILSDDQLVVYKCDFGSIDLLPPNALRTLDPEFKQLPQLAIQAKSHGEDKIKICIHFFTEKRSSLIIESFSEWTTGIQPRNSVWNIDDCARFQQRTVGKQFAAQIKAIRKDTSQYTQQYILELILIDVSKSHDVNINDELVKEQRAISA